ncbi:MAG: 30S ribosomal protein S5 [Candidatus Aenigmarchaeota archaeon]|nr:30S ribosomal protein S5 [Candidatus Aenigmarchaeota archaeon]
MTDRKPKKSQPKVKRESKEQEEKHKQEISAGEKVTEADIKNEGPKVEVPEGWVPRTDLGRAVFDGRITDIDQIFKEGYKIAESEIVDTLFPNLENEIIMIGGTSGKGGGIRRTISRRTTRMHKSGRRFRVSVMVVVGNRDGYLGIGIASGPPNMHRGVINKALHKAKLNIIPITRGCGSWECGCGSTHSIPIKTVGKTGSVSVYLMPAPKGIGLCCSAEMKKVMRLAGITDIWVKTRGHSQTRYNFAKAVFNAIKKVNTIRMTETQMKKIGACMGKVE